MDKDRPVAIVTGANSGIGEATVAGIATTGHQVIMACRDMVKAEASRARILAQVPDATIEIVQVDLADPASIAASTKAVRKHTKTIDALVNNAGVWMRERVENTEGHEMTFAVNHLGTFRFTAAMMPMVHAAPAGRVVNVASVAHRFARLDLEDLDWKKRRFNGNAQYCTTKLCNILFTRALAHRLQDTNETANCVHPGTGGTGLTREFPRFVTGALKALWRAPSKLAETQVHAATSPHVFEQNGVYFFDKKVRKPSSQARDPALAEALWAKTVAMTGIDIATR